MSRIPFEQSLDKTRPRVLVLPANARKSHTLHYRYTDTGEEVVVPNVWYNQTSAGQAATYRQRIQLNCVDLDRLARSAYQGDRVTSELRGRLVRRNAELKDLAEAHELDAQNDGMAVYSCGNPLPDRESFARTMAAWAEYLEVRPQLDAAFSAIQSVDDVHEWERMCANALQELRTAFYFDTSDINSRQGANQMQIGNFENLVSGLQRQRMLAAA